MTHSKMVTGSFTQSLRHATPVFLGLGALAGIAAGLIYAHHNSIHLAKTSAGIVKIHTIEDENGNPVRVLEQNGAYESATYLDGKRYTPVFAYQRAFDHVFEANLPSPKASLSNIPVLMIGGGGYAWPKHTIATKPEISLEVVELDQKITAIAQKWFYLNQLLEEIPHAADRLMLITADGRRFLETTDKHYAAIINDTFSGKSPVLSLATIEAAQIVKERLLAGGVYATNVVSECEGEDITFLRQVVTTLKEVFAFVDIIPCEDSDFGLEDNYLVLASDTQHPFTNTMPYDEDFLGSSIRDSDI